MKRPGPTPRPGGVRVTIAEYNSPGQVGQDAVLIQATVSSPTTWPAHVQGRGTLEASMVKAYVCRAAEWVTREALQITGAWATPRSFR